MVVHCHLAAFKCLSAVEETNRCQQWPQSVLQESIRVPYYGYYTIKPCIAFQKGRLKHQRKHQKWKMAYNSPFLLYTLNLGIRRGKAKGACFWVDKYSVVLLNSCPAYFALPHKEKKPCRWGFLFCQRAVNLRTGERKVQTDINIGCLSAFITK